jgi:hypothetical protein
MRSCNTPNNNHIDHSPRDRKLTMGWSNISVLKKLNHCHGYSYDAIQLLILNLNLNITVPLSRLDTKRVARLVSSYVTDVYNGSGNRRGLHEYKAEYFHQNGLCRVYMNCGPVHRHHRGNGNVCHLLGPQIFYLCHRSCTDLLIWITD